MAIVGQITIGSGLDPVPWTRTFVFNEVGSAPVDHPEHLGSRSPRWSPDDLRHTWH